MSHFVDPLRPLNMRRILWMPPYVWVSTLCFVDTRYSFTNAYWLKKLNNEMLIQNKDNKSFLFFCYRWVHLAANYLMRFTACTVSIKKKKRRRMFCMGVSIFYFSVHYFLPLSSSFFYHQEILCMRDFCIYIKELLNFIPLFLFCIKLGKAFL